MNDLQRQLAEIRKKTKRYPGNQDYLSRRQEFAKSIGYPDLFRFIDQFGLYAGTQTLATRLMAYEVVKQSVSVPGHIMEFGVWDGSNLMFMAKLLELLQPATCKQVFGFDNFAGLPAPHALDGVDAKSMVGHYKGNEEVLRKAIDLYDMDDFVQLVVGDALETIPAFEKEFPEAMVSLAWIDFDLYEPCKVALDFLAQRLSVGGIIVFDEAISSAWPGETVAMREFLESSGGKYRMEANVLGRQPSLYLVRES